jgi:AraC-like DNA-binding protein
MSSSAVRQSVSIPVRSTPLKATPPISATRQAEIALLHTLFTTNGATQSAIPFLTVNRSTHPTALAPSIIEPSLCLVIQGRKKALIADEIIYYEADDIIVASMDTPISGHVVSASSTLPYYSVRLALDAQEILSLVLESKLPMPTQAHAASRAYVSRASVELRDAIFRLIRLLATPQDIPFIANSIKQEIFYRLLTSEDGYRFYQNLRSDYAERGIYKAISWLKHHYSQPLRVETLAKEINMSVSGFHHKFKAITTLSPLQYQKRLRLLEARRLLLVGGVDAATAGFTVGYESPSQFSREYRRLFGAPPLKDIETIKQSAMAKPEQF